MASIKFFLLLLLSAGFSAMASAAEDVTGLWQTIDDETGQPKSIVEITEVDGSLQGKVVKLLLKPNDTLCEACEGDLHQQPVVGMTIMSGLSKDGDEYNDGEIIDPENGKSYRCKLWLEDGQLKVRGYIGFLYRTQSWQRVTAAQ